MINWIIYAFVRFFLALVQLLPLRFGARLGRAGGAVAYWVDARHRGVALRNLAMCFPEKDEQEIRAIAQENFRRIGENFTCAIITASMSSEELAEVCELPVGNLEGAENAAAPFRNVMAIGHFGNFELYNRFCGSVADCACASTYRGLPNKGINRALQWLRASSECRFFDRRYEAAALKTCMRSNRRVFLGLLVDQHAGDRGLRVPFMGNECSTSAAAAVFALRYNCKLRTGFCYRTGLAKWRLESGPEIALRNNGTPRPLEDIMRDVNRAFEAAVRRDPANWFWVHNRWKLKWRRQAAIESPVRRTRSVVRERQPSPSYD